MKKTITIRREGNFIILEDRENGELLRVTRLTLEEAITFFTSGLILAREPAR